MFPEDPKARSDFRTGTLYAIWGAGDWIYYGQVCADKSVGFFRRRDREIVDTTSVLASQIMSRLAVNRPSIGQALRYGAWKKLGNLTLHNELDTIFSWVQWPVGTLDVTVWIGGKRNRVTCVDDPSIQHLEVGASWDAVHHIPARLAVDYAPDEASDTVANAWSIGGPIWRARRVKEEIARRHPNKPWTALPTGWVPTQASKH
jgi:hypothetical protein